MNKSLIQYLLVILVTTIVYSAILYLAGAAQQILNCLFGIILMSSNFFVLWWSFKHVFEKKSVAKATTIIVIKYAALLGIMTGLYIAGWRINVGFAVGLSVVFPLVGWMAISFVKQREIHGSF